jgi:hypothetical protein
VAPAAPTPEPSTEPAPTFTSSDSFGWDDWDGTSDALPEEVRGWYSQFDTRWNTERERLTGEHATALEDATSRSGQYKRMYEALMSGTEDPRIGELNTELETTRTQYTTLQAEVAEYQKAVEEHDEREAGRYYKWVEENYSDHLNAMKGQEGAEQDVFALMGGEHDDGLELHHALAIWQKGPEAVEIAKKALADGVPEEYIVKLAGGVTPKPASNTPAKPKLVAPRATTQVVTGATPATVPKPPPAPDKRNLTREQARMEAVRKALNGR